MSRGGNGMELGGYSFHWKKLKYIFMCEKLYNISSVKFILVGVYRSPISDDNIFFNYWN